MEKLSEAASRVVIARPRRGRGALSAQREEVPLGCNLGKALTISPMAFLLSNLVLRDCHVASLLAMTSLIASCRRQMPKPGVRGGRILKFVTNFSFFPLDFLPEMGII